jgi:N-dimethylarginine dimethylaminohydrolase/glycosyltransferase involved in cell wall biosynthesis
MMRHHGRVKQANMEPFTDHTDGALYHRAQAPAADGEAPETALDSPLLDLVRSSDVNPIPADQVRDARSVLRARQELIRSGRPAPEDVLRLQRRIVERFLAGRRAHFGEAQCAPLAEAAEMAQEGRDVFIVIKFMDEAPHIQATLHSLLAQRNVDLGRVVVVAVDNNSADGSDLIVKQTFSAAGQTPARLVYLNQSTPGAGHAARLGVDRAIATVYSMCLSDQRWERLQTACIGVSDGDTVYHPDVLSECLRIFAADPATDGCMPFLLYKFSAALRLFPSYSAYSAEALGRRAAAAPQQVPVPLGDVTAYDALPRAGRRRAGDVMELAMAGGGTVTVPLGSTDETGRRFGVIQDPAGRRAFQFEDRTLVLAEAPGAGFDGALVFLENGGVTAGDKWRWHALVAHDLFLYWAFAGMGLPEAMVYPDTSDALKMFRAWSFAIGGQHQLRRPDLRIATGSDYQSGRVLQAVGGTVRLGPARAYAETEVDRLIKMARNMAHSQSVFYGETRGGPLARATGLYVHMTRIQGEIEHELRGYPDSVFAAKIFPERVLLPLRWMLQNAIRFFTHPDGTARELVRRRVLQVIFPPTAAAQVERDWLDERNLSALRQPGHYERQAAAERIAEAAIAANYQHLMSFYVRTLRSFFQSQQVASEHYEWLLAGVESSRNAILQRPPRVRPADVWQQAEFDIDTARGQAVRVKKECAVEPRPTKVNCWNEWDPLRHVILGRADGTVVQAPELAVVRDWPDDGFPRGTYGPLPADMVAAANEQLDNLARILEARGIRVDRTIPIPFDQPVSTPEWTQDSMFGCMPPRDVIITVGNEILEATMCYRSRWFEYLCYRPLIESYFADDPAMRWEAAPKPRLTEASYKPGFLTEFEALDPARQIDRVRRNDLGLTEAEPLFDAADVVRLGKDLFVQLSLVTNRGGHRWLKQHFPDFRVHAVTFDNIHPLHIDATWVPLRPGLVLHCAERPADEELRTYFKVNDWEIVNAAQPNRSWAALPRLCFCSPWLSLNLLSLDPRTVCVEASETAQMEQLYRLGFEVIPVPFWDVAPFGGGLHCATVDVLREGSCQDYFPIRHGRF